jgi:hypothetical protein
MRVRPASPFEGYGGQIEHLPGGVINRRRFGQRLAARRTGFRIMVDRDIGGFRPSSRLSGMAGLTAGVLAGRFTQAADARRLFSPSLDGGLPLSLLFRPRRRSNFANRAANAAFSTRSNAFSARNAAITASLLVAHGAPSPQVGSPGPVIGTLTRTRP